MNQICVIGDVNVDIVSLLEEPLQINSDTQTTNRLSLGGSPCNMAVWLSHLGASVDFIAAIGDDILGTWVKAQLHEAGLAIENLEVVPGSTSGTCLILVNADGNRTMLPDPGANLALQLTDSHIKTITESSVVVMSAYTFLRPQTRPIAHQVADVVASSSARLVLDAASSAPIAQAGVELVRDYLARADLVLANEDEFALLAEQEWLNKVENLVVKLGAKGAKWFVSGQEVCAAPASDIKVLDTTGAGDSFLAGLVSNLAEHSDWYAISADDRKIGLMQAVKVAQENITKIGAGPR